MIASPDLWLLMIEREQEEDRKMAERERLASVIRQARRQQRLATIVCALARRLIAVGMLILNRFDDEPAALRQRRV